MEGLDALRRELQAHDDLLERSLNGTGNGSRAQAQEALMRMEHSLADFRAQAARLPSDSRAPATAQCESFARRLATHRAKIDASQQDAQRNRLLESHADGKRKPSESKTQAENDAREVAASTRTRDQMASVLNQMHATAEALDESSRRLKEGQDKSVEYAMKLDSATKVLGVLKKKTEEDTKYIWWSFCFFLAVVVYIVLRRLKVFRIISIAVSTTIWGGSTAVNVGQVGASQLYDIYGWFCAQFGIPNPFVVAVE